MTKYAKVEDMDKETRAALLGSLFGDELFLGGITCTDAFRSSRQTRLVLTDQRLITFQRKADTHPLTEIDRSDIYTAEFNKGILTRKLTVTGSNGFSQEWDLNIDGASEFAEAVQSHDTYAIYDNDAVTEHRSQNNVIDNYQSSPTANTETDENLHKSRHKTKDRSKTGANDQRRKNIGESTTDQHSIVADLSQTELLSKLQSVDDYEFEHLVADLWEQMEWDTEVSQASMDAGIDVTATKSTPYPQKKVIQAKRYGENTSVGGPDIQQYASLKHQVETADSVVVVTSGSFTSSAEERADELNVKTVDGEGLVTMIDDLDAHDTIVEYLDVSPKPSPEPTVGSEENLQPSNEDRFDSSVATEASQRTSTVDRGGNSSSGDDGEPSKILHVADRITGVADQATDQESANPKISVPTNTSERSETRDGSDSVQGAGNWHYGIAGLSVIATLALFAGASDIGGISLLLLLGVTYLDIRNLRSVPSEWNPRALLYLPAMLFVVFIAAPIYLYQRRSAVGL